MKLAIVYSGKYTDGVESIAKELGGTFSTRQLEAWKEVLSIRVDDGDEFSIKGPLREYEDVPIGFVESLTRNLKVEWDRDLNLADGEEIVVTVSSREDLDVLRWMLWCYLEGVVDRKIGRLWI